MENRFRILNIKSTWLPYYVALVMISYLLYKINFFNDIVQKNEYNIILIWIVVLTIFSWPIAKMWGHLVITEDYLQIDQSGNQINIQKSNIKKIDIFQSGYSGSSSYWITIYLVDSPKIYPDFKLNYSRRHFKTIKKLIKEFNYPYLDWRDQKYD